MSMMFENRREHHHEHEGPPRRARVKIHDHRGIAWRPSVANLINATGCFNLLARDILDFGLDFSEWLQMNGDSVLKTVTWAAASDSPSAPTIVASQFFPAGEAFVVVGPGVVGDIYWLDCTVTIDVVQQRGGEAIPVVSRTLVRRIAITVLAG